ncbi:hypothetical protein SK128_010429 [Halocaridina rubra]|uniref:Peptidase M14 domain-containing protein n=1 Tax=Halocaridina rubra TaxID=373956 RepID=A0AAN8WTM4_HALRR
MPLVNPDGYTYSITTDRMWRKNRANTTDSGCYGVDLNRNFNVSWGNVNGASLSQCSYNFCGTEAFSEPESRAIRDLALAYLPNIKLFMTLHSYGQLLLYPWGYTFDKAPKKGKLHGMARKIIGHTSSRGTYDFVFGQSSWVLYRATGTSDDYMYSKGVPFSYTLELPNENSFILPAMDIIPIGQQIWEALVCIIGDVVKTTKAKKFCNKRLVVATTSDNITISNWVRRSMPLEKAKEKIIKRYEKKQMSKLLLQQKLKQKREGARKKKMR